MRIYRLVKKPLMHPRQNPWELAGDKKLLKVSSTEWLTCSIGGEDRCAGGSVKDPEKKTQERETEREKVLRTRHNQLLEFFIRRLGGVTSRRAKESKEIKLSEGNKTTSTIYTMPIKRQVHSGYCIFRCLLNALLLSFEGDVYKLLNSRSPACGMQCSERLTEFVSKWRLEFKKQRTQKLGTTKLSFSTFCFLMHIKKMNQK